MSVKIVETALRDGHQSLLATRLTTKEIVNVVEEMDQVGYYALEVWGGATFDACIRFLNEDPWERLRLIRERVKNTKLQMLLRGQNILGYKHYPDDIVDKFVQKSIENGIDIIRVFDALNDVRNLKKSILSIKKYDGHCQCAICYTTSPVHTIDYYVNLAKEFEEQGADSICIKDMAGILKPYDAYELVRRLKSELNIPIDLHTHSTTGIAEMTILKAIEAGVDIVDTAISPLSRGTSQMATESLVETLNIKESINTERLKKVTEYFRKIRDKYIENGMLKTKALFTNPQILEYQVPGGMLSNLMGQLQNQNKLHLYQEVLEEVPRVRKDLGYPPLVTPLSQMVGTQAVFNVVTGKRYKIIPQEIKDYVKGYYGKSPGQIERSIIKLIIGDEETIDYRPADDLKPMFKQIKEENIDLIKSDEDVLSIALFPNVAKPFLEKKYFQEEKEIHKINLHIG